MIGWMIAGGILLVILLLLFAPVTAHLSYGPALKVQLKYLFFTFSLLPAKKKKEAGEPKPPQKAEKKEAEGEPSKESTQSVLEILEMVKMILSSLKKPIKILLKGLCIHDLRVRMVISKEEAQDTAMSYGKLNAAFYSCLALAKNVVKIKRTQLALTPSFVKVPETVEAYGEVSIRPITVLHGAFAFLFSFGFKFLKSVKEKKKNTPQAPKAQKIAKEARPATEQKPAAEPS